MLIFFVNLLSSNQAAKDFESAVSLDPNNSELQKLLENARQKYLEVEGIEIGGVKANILKQSTSNSLNINKSQEEDTFVSKNLIIQEVDDVDGFLGSTLINAQQLLAGTLTTYATADELNAFFGRTVKKGLHCSLYY